jgi:hypothetical protein
MIHGVPLPMHVCVCVCLSVCLWSIHDDCKINTLHIKWLYLLKEILYCYNYCTTVHAAGTILKDVSSKTNLTLDGFSHWDHSPSKIPTITLSVTTYSSHPSLLFTTLGTISACSHWTPRLRYFEMPKHVGVY